MPKYTLILIVIFIGIIVYLFYPFKFKTKNIKINDQDFTIEIATTPSQLSLGLGNRSSLCQNCGMLFVFPSPQILQFWMKDTLIPLDMIFIDQNKKIVNIITAPINDLRLYNSTSPSLYCLELNAGTTTKLNLKSGDVLNF
ncbi:MAG: DUF192 domain-containing protein [Candidatus Shapirobacteria bacterium]